jgi:serpin peptidase inhibitor clade A protein 3
VHLGNTLLLSGDLELLPGFLNSTMTFYDPKLFRPDFSDTVGTTKLINDHVKKETRGKITDLVSELTPDVKMIVVNYIYFKGEVRALCQPISEHGGHWPLLLCEVWGGMV